MRFPITLPALLSVLTPLCAAPPQETTPRLDDLASIERRVRATCEKVGPAVVRITCGEDREMPCGGGVIVTADGHVVSTSRLSFVSRADAPVSFHLPGGRRVKGTALGWSQEWSLGLMKISEDGPWPHVNLAEPGDVRAGQLCVAVGYPFVPGPEFDRQPAASLGCVTSSAVSIWLTSSCVVASSLGSAVFDLEGQLVGLTTKIPPPMSSRDPVHVSIELMRTHWDDFIRGEDLDRLRLLHSAKSAGERRGTGDSQLQPAAEEEREAAAIEKAKPAAVKILVGGKGRVSAVVVSSDGYVVTCGHHRILPGEKVTIRFHDGREAAGVVLGTNLVSDVGLMKITDKGPWPYVELGDSTILRADDPCILLGYPGHRWDKPPLVRKGRIVEPQDQAWSSLLSTSLSSPTYGGDSGSGVFDLEGNVVGVHSGRNRNVRVEVLRKQWDNLAAGKPVDVMKSEPLGEIKAIFRHLANDLGPIVVEVLRDNKQRAVGVVVRSDGRILTKASGLFGAISCRLADGRVLPAAIEKVSREHDLAILKVDAKDLPEARWSRTEIAPAGALIAALTPGKPPLAGVVSHTVRSIPPESGWLGVELKDSDRGLEVHDDEMVAQYMGSEFDMPIRKGDIIVHIEGRPTPNLKTCLELLEPEAGDPVACAGDVIRAGVRRGDDSLELRFPLAPTSSGFPTYVSRRYSGFPSVFETHILLPPNLCGAPVIDRTGRVAGIAIACRNQGRIAVIPAAVAGKLAAD